jgi:hypothetical protein
MLTNANLLRQGVAIESVLKSLIQTPIKYEELLVGDRDALIIAARILAYGHEYSFTYKNPDTGESEKINYDLSNLDHKKIDASLLNPKNEFHFELPFTKNEVTFRLLTVDDQRKIDEEIKGVKKATGVELGAMSMRLKHQITSINGDYSTKSIRSFIDDGYLLTKDSMALRKYIDSITPQMDTSITFIDKSGREVTMELPMTAEFFFPWL